MLSCPNCGEENPERAKFCLSCATPLRPAAPILEERRVVSILFCDLVGFTASSDRADPEDVKDRLRPFHTRMKDEIEAFGGHLEKFIGDAALGVFGWPVAHEDDPERAVRAGLAIVKAMEALNAEDPSLNIAVRVGINTGEAVVALGSGPLIGEGVVGDVVNTASRLQGVAPVGGVVVGEPTFRATDDVFDYEDLPAVVVKGKADPLEIWRAVASRGLHGADITRTHRHAFVGRGAERTLLIQAFERAARESSVGLALVVGEPGVGKSRLMAELARHVGSPSGAAGWHRGRCLPYGEGITFWALGEVVKAHAGILETDDATTIAARLDAAIPAHEPDRDWLRERLAPLAGTEATSPAERDESFTAWRRFLELLTAGGPAVVLFEDLHWADPSLLAFIDHVASRSTGAPLLLAGTARPELFDRQPEWPTATCDTARLDLRPLSGSDAQALASSVLDEAPASAELRDLIVERCGGNPLYAEEFVRALRERDLLVDRDGGLGLIAEAAIPAPESIHSLIASRLDVLGASGKATAQDAAVVGRVFWPGAVAHVEDRDPATVVNDLERLSDRELVRRSPASSVRDHEEFAFWHALVRDVAYGQIPRAARARKHVRVAEWIESIAGDALGDLAEILAHHAVTALQLAPTAVGRDELATRARRYLRLAGTRAMGLDVSRAGELLVQALDLAPADAPDRGRILSGLAEAAFQAGRLKEADDRYGEAVTALRSTGETVAAGEAMARQSVVREYRGDATQGRALLAEAIGVLRGADARPQLARALATSAGSRMVEGSYRDGIEEAQRAVELADSVGERQASARARAFLGYGRTVLGERAGIDQQREALRDLLALGVGRAAAVTYNNLGGALLLVHGPQEALELWREGVEFAHRRGLGESVTAIENSMLQALRETGAWDEALRLIEVVARAAAKQGSRYDEVYVQTDRALIEVARHGAAALDRCEAVLAACRELDDPPMLFPAMLAAAEARLASGNREGAAGLIVELLDLAESDPSLKAIDLPQLARLAVGSGRRDLGVRILEGTDQLSLARYRLAQAGASAILIEAHGDVRAAATGYEDAVRQARALGVVPEEALARLGRGRCLLAQGDDAPARRELAGARDIFVSLEAPALVAQADAALAGA